MKVVHTSLLFGTGARVKGLSMPIDNDEPQRKGDSNAPAKRVLSLTGVTGNVTCNWGSYDEIRLSTVGSVVLTFTGATNGQGCILTLKGGNSVSLPANVRFNSQVNAYVPTSGASAIDKIGFTYDADDLKYDFVSLIKGIA